MELRASRPVDWYAIRSNIKCEKRAELGLREQGFDVYLPSITKWCRHSRRKTRVQRPLMIRYLFVALDRDEPQFYRVRQTDGVECIVGTLGEPIAVPPKWVDELRTAEIAGDFDETRPANFVDITVGQRVRITGGPFTGFMAEVRRAKTGEAKARVLLQAIRKGGAEHEMEIDLVKLEAA
jgi:transcription antitermination factor NusG